MMMIIIVMRICSLNLTILNNCNYNFDLNNNGN